MSKVLREFLRGLTKGKVISGDGTFKNPNRVQRSKLNLRPDQAKRLNAMGPKKHKVVRRMLDMMFDEADKLQAAS